VIKSLVVSDRRISGSASTDDEAFCGECIVTPTPGGWQSTPGGRQWANTLRGQKCKGNTIILDLDGNLYALRALGTDDVLTGYVNYKTYIDDDWVAFRATSISRRETSDGSIEVVICLRDGSQTIPVDLALSDGSSDIVLDHTDKLTIKQVPGQREIEWTQKKADTFEDRDHWWIPSWLFSARPNEGKSGTMSPLPKSILRKCASS